MAYIITGTVVVAAAFAIIAAFVVIFLKRRTRHDEIGTDVAERLGMPTAVPLHGRNMAVEPSPTEILLGSSRDHPAIRISKLEALTASAVGTGRSISSPGISRLNSLIGACGPLATKLASGGNLMRVEVAGSLARAAGTDGFRGYVVEGGRIVEHAVLNPSSIASVATGAFAFQIVSMVVAQKHLADIDRRLQDLQTAVGGLQDYLEDGRRAQITSSMSYLRQLAGLVLSGKLDPAARFQIEQRELELMQVQHHLASGMDRAKETLDRFKGSDWVGSLEISSQIEAIHAKVEALSDEWMMAHAARIAALQLLSATEASIDLVAGRKTAIASDLDAFTKRQLPEHRRYFRSKIPLIESWFNSAETLDQRRCEANARTDRFIARMHSDVRALRSEIARQGRLAAEIEAPLSLRVEFTDGQVSRAFVLPREPIVTPKASGGTATRSL